MSFAKSTHLKDGEATVASIDFGGRGPNAKVERVFLADLSGFNVGYDPKRRLKNQPYIEVDASQDILVKDRLAISVSVLPRLAEKDRKVTQSAFKAARAREPRYFMPCNVNPRGPFFRGLLGDTLTESEVGEVEELSIYHLRLLACSMGCSQYWAFRASKKEIRKKVIKKIASRAKLTVHCTDQTISEGFLEALCGGTVSRAELFLMKKVELMVLAFGAGYEWALYVPSREELIGSIWEAIGDDPRNGYVPPLSAEPSGYDERVPRICPHKDSLKLVSANS